MYADLNAIQFRINTAGRTFCGADWRWNSTTTPWHDYDLWTVIRGNGSMHTPAGVFDLIPGSCFVLRGPDAYLGTTDPVTPLGVAHIHFDCLDAGGAVLPRPRVEALFPFFRMVDDVAWFDGLAQRIVELRLSGDDDARQAANHLLKSALLEVRRLDRRPAQSGLELEQARKIDAICQRLANDPGHPWRIAELAAECAYGADHFARLFRSLKGMTPREYLQRTRMNRARSLLRFSSHSVLEIAHLLGYGDLQHFSRHFRSRHGVGPRDYRRTPQR